MEQQAAEIRLDVERRTAAKAGLHARRDCADAITVSASAWLRLPASGIFGMGRLR
jgi:hypothetical protein